MGHIFTGDPWIWHETFPTIIFNNEGNLLKKKRKLTTSLFFFSLLPSFFLYSGPWEIQPNFAPLHTFSSSNLGMWREVETLVWMLPIIMSFWTTIQMSEWYLFEWYIISKRKYLPKEVCHPSFPIRMRSDVYLKAQ